MQNLSPLEWDSRTGIAQIRLDLGYDLMICAPQLLLTSMLTTIK